MRAEAGSFNDYGLACHGQLIAARRPRGTPMAHTPPPSMLEKRQRKQQTAKVWPWVWPRYSFELECPGGGCAEGPCASYQCFPPLSFSIRDVANLARLALCLRTDETIALPSKASNRCRFSWAARGLIAHVNYQLLEYVYVEFLPIGWHGNGQHWISIAQAQ